jgi:hypothetical protein
MHAANPPGSNFHKYTYDKYTYERAGPTGPHRPAAMFDREREWVALSAFAQDSTRGTSLGIVSGWRRQGKTFLLRALCQATGGFYFAAEEATDAESLQLIGAALADHLGAPSPLTFRDCLGRKSGDLAHPLTILEDCGLIVQVG